MKTMVKFIDQIVFKTEQKEVRAKASQMEKRSLRKLLTNADLITEGKGEVADRNSTMQEEIE